MKLKYITAFAATLIFAATSCSDDDWQPGPDVNPDCMTVYFEPLNSYNLIIEPDDSRLIPVTVGRAKYDEAATVPLTVSQKPEGVVIPESVDFAAGEQAKTIFIDIENMASKSSGTVSISIPEELTSPYAAGNAIINLNITVSGAWLPLANNAYYYFDDDAYPEADADIYMLEGTNNFKIANFLNSGIDFVFTVEEPGTGSLAIIPVRNYLDVSEVWDNYDYDGWVLFDEATYTYPEWSPDGSFPYIEILEFDPAYANINVGSGYIYFSPYFRYTDGTATYHTVWFVFTPLFDPFTDSAE